MQDLKLNKVFMGKSLCLSVTERKKESKRGYLIACGSFSQVKQWMLKLPCFSCVLSTSETEQIFPWFLATLRSSKRADDDSSPERTLRGQCYISEWLCLPVQGSSQLSPLSRFAQWGTATDFPEAWRSLGTYRKSRVQHDKISIQFPRAAR